MDRAAAKKKPALRIQILIPYSYPDIVTGKQFNYALT